MSDSTVDRSDLSAEAWTPTGRAHLIDPQSFVFWVFAVAAVYGGIHLFSAIAATPAVQALPANSWLALVEWAIYGGVFLSVVYYHQLFVRRSAWVTVGALLWGGLVATWFASQANAALEDIFSHWFSTDFESRWGFSIAAATNEEMLKLLGLVVLVLLPHAKVRSTLDGWFYGMMIGLGFQVVEDYIYTVNQSGSLAEVFGFLVQRGLFAGIWAHAVYTGIVGVGVGYLVSRTDRTWLRRIAVAVALFLVAWTFHFLWDAPFINDWFGDGTGAFLLVILIKGAPALATMFLVLRWGRGHERKVWASFVRDNIGTDLVSESEAVALLSRRSRRAAQKAAGQAGGHAAAHRQKRLQRAQLTYVQCVTEEGADSTGAHAAAELIAELRDSQELTIATA